MKQVFADGDVVKVAYKDITKIDEEFQQYQGRTGRVVGYDPSDENGCPYRVQFGKGKSYRLVAFERKYLTLA